MFLTRYTNLLKKQKGCTTPQWLVFQFDRRIWPRLQTVSAKNAMNLAASMRFSLKSITMQLYPHG